MNQRIAIEAPPKPPPSKNLKGMVPPHPMLPQIPFFVGIVGPRHSGKTVLLYNLLSTKPGMYGKTFKKENIVFFSPTKDKDPTLHALKLKNVYGPPTSAEWLVNNIVEQQKAFAEIDDLTGVLMVFDDITQIRDAWKPLENLSYLGRHDHIHVLYVSHKISSIPRGIRTQTQQWILFKPHEESERQWILETFSRSRTYDIWNDAMMRAWKIPHNFVYIDFERKDPNEVYRSGFNDPLFTSEEIFILENGMNDDIVQEETMEKSETIIKDESS